MNILQKWSKKLDSLVGLLDDLVEPVKMKVKLAVHGTLVVSDLFVQDQSTDCRAYILFSSVSVQSWRMCCFTLHL